MNVKGKKVSFSSLSMCCECESGMEERAQPNTNDTLELAVTDSSDLPNIPSLSTVIVSFHLYFFFGYVMGTDKDSDWSINKLLS